MRPGRRFAAAVLSAAIGLSLCAPAGAVEIGQGSLGGQTGSPSASTTRYNTMDFRQENDDKKNRDELDGALRQSSMEATRRMYEYWSGSKTLVIVGYGRLEGVMEEVGEAYTTPGVIGGNVLKEHRASWLDGFYPGTWDGMPNGPDGTKDWKGDELYASHETLDAGAIEHIIFDDPSTAISEDLGNDFERQHDSYAMSEMDYASGVTSIAPYTFANLYNLKSVDFDNTQITEIGDYAFAGCESLGSESAKTAAVEMHYGSDSDWGAENGDSRWVQSHDYVSAGYVHEFDARCTCQDSPNPDPDYKEAANRILLPHSLVRMGEHVFQNCPQIQEYVIHRDNQYLVASVRQSSFTTAEWDRFTDGVLYTKGAATGTIVKETAYTRLRAAVIADYQNCPAAYKSFWIGPFGETEPMPLEWYVKSWNAREESAKRYGSACPAEHFNWTEIEAAAEKAAAANGHLSTDGRTVTRDYSNWTNYLSTNPDHEYTAAWWDDNYFDSGTKDFGYDRSKFLSDASTGGTNSVAQAKVLFENYVDGGNATGFNTLLLFPEGRTGSFFVWPGHDPSQYESQGVAHGNRDNDMGSPVTTIAPFAFANCQLSSVDMTTCDQLTTFGQGTFLNSRSLSTVILPEGGTESNGSKTPSPAGRKPNYQLTKLADDMFSQCTSLSRIQNLDRDLGRTMNLGSMEYQDHGIDPGGEADYLSTIQEFGQNCFHKCLSLTPSTFGPGLPDSLLIIGQSAFHTCKNLTGLTIHKNVEIIGDYAFSDCYNLSDLSFECKDEPCPNGGGAEDRIPDHRNATSENKNRQFYISGGDSEAGVAKAVQFGNKTFEHCTALSGLQLGSDWLIQPTTFEHDIYLLRIECNTSYGEKNIYGYDFQNGRTGQDGNSPDRAGGAVALSGTGSPYFDDCAYRKGLEKQGTAWVKRPG